jgi:hypothetical protein
VRTVHHPTVHNRSQTRPPVRCYRHSKWMAYCIDCKAAHAPLLRSGDETEASPPHATVR